MDSLFDTIDRHYSTADQREGQKGGGPSAEAEGEQSRKRSRPGTGVSNLLDGATALPLPAMPPAQRARRPAASGAAAPSSSPAAGASVQARAIQSLVGHTFEDPQGKAQDPDLMDLPNTLAAFHRAHGVRVDRTVIPAPLIKEVVDLVDQRKVKLILNLSLHAGFFADAALQGTRQAKMISIDPMRYSPVPQYAASFLGRRHRGRHMVLAGSPVEALTAFTKMFGRCPVGLVLLDLRADAPALGRVLKLLSGFLRPGTPIVVNNLVPHRPDGACTLKEWTAAVEGGVVKETRHGHTDKVRDLWVIGATLTESDRQAIGAATPQSKAAKFVQTSPIIKLYEYGQRLDKARTCERALEVWNELVSSSLEPDSWAYNSLLKWLRRDTSGQYRDMVARLRAEMREKGFEEIAR